MTRRRASSVNEGIQATSVSADVLAVGRRARAVKHATAGEPASPALQSAIVELRRAIDALALQPPVRQSLAGDLAKLEELGKTPTPAPADTQSALSGLAAKLRAAGVVLTETASLAAPVKTIAGLLKVAVESIWT